MSNLRQAAQQALEALEGLADYRYTDRVKNTMASLRQALAEPEQPTCKESLQVQEPVLCINPKVINPATGKVRTRTGALTFSDEPCDGWYLPLYTAPTPRKPLTDEEMRECAQAMNAEPLAEGWPELIKFARAIENKHGIGEQHE